jgi:hypothetical protein
MPGALAGSVCGRGLSGNPVSTIGFERRNNEAFRIANEDEFVTQMLKDIPPPPPRAAEFRAANAGLEAAQPRPGWRRGESFGGLELIDRSLARRWKINRRTGAIEYEHEASSSDGAIR